MRSCKKDIIGFLVWLRNGTAFCTTWFLVLMLAFSYAFNRGTISVDSLTKMLLFVFGGVFIFCLCFTRLFIRRWSFIKRLNCFVLSFGLYECAAFYLSGIFAGKGTIFQWLIFIGIVSVSYFICIAIYQRYSKKQGELYTQALKNYQQQRGKMDEE